MKKDTLERAIHTARQLAREVEGLGLFVVGTPEEIQAQLEKMREQPRG